ncbi:MAG: ABC transporter permease [Treponema sp.]|jgi:lipoprotein-releasing system permease protein|nr:ABC transporter permease [Treponema sp.]
MSKRKQLLPRWVLFVSNRFARVDRKGRSAVTTFLASLGICFGVMTLIVVISVMNGFQMSFIDAIMEISSYHLRVTDVPPAAAAGFEQFCADSEQIRAAVPFYEAQSLMVGTANRQAAAIVRAVPADICSKDNGFAKELTLVSGSFDLSGDTIVIGADLARNLGVTLGSSVNLFALSGGSDVDLLSPDRIFSVVGIFQSGYADINSSYSFISLAAGKRYFGKNASLVYGLKLRNSGADSEAAAMLAAEFPEIKTESWRSYNRAFFGALRIEKTMLMLLVCLIFVVVGINIFNGMRRLVYERRSEISVLSALGGNSRYIQIIFILRGFLTGFEGAVPGLALGLLLSVRIGSVFVFAAKAIYAVQYFFTMIASPADSIFIRENPMYFVYAQIPARIVPQEVLLITIFGIFSSLLASWVASRSVLQMTAAEVLRDE